MIKFSKEKILLLHKMESMGTVLFDSFTKLIYR